VAICAATNETAGSFLRLSMFLGDKDRIAPRTSVFCYKMVPTGECVSGDRLTLHLWHYETILVAGVICAAADGVACSNLSDSERASALIVVATCLHRISISGRPDATRAS